MGKVKQRTKYVKRRKFAGNQFVDAFRRHKSSHEANLQEDETLKSAEYEEESPPSLPRPFANILDDGRPVPGSAEGAGGETASDAHCSNV